MALSRHLFTGLIFPETFSWKVLQKQYLPEQFSNNRLTKTEIAANIRKIFKKEGIRVLDNYAQCMQVYFQNYLSHLDHIIDRTLLLCKATKKTDTFGNDRRLNEVLIKKFRKACRNFIQFVKS